MCGGLIVAVARTRTETLIYHLGRLFGYSVLGALGGILGEKFLGPAAEGVISWIAAAAVSASLILIGIRTWSGSSPHFFRLPSSFTQFLFRHAQKNAFLTGAFSAFLPCGWLQNFVLAAAATRNTTSGALLLFFFWLGTLPALTFTPFLVEKLFRPISQKLPRLSAILLISAGLFSIGIKTSPLLRGHSSESKSCHITEETQSSPSVKPLEHDHHHHPL